MEVADMGQGAGAPAPPLPPPQAPDAWQRFLQTHGELLARDLAVRHPQFTAALWRLEHDSRGELERRSQQALLALRHKDERIAELEQTLAPSHAQNAALAAAQTRATQLQAVVAEQREQIDVLLDELERVQAACATATQRLEAASQPTAMHTDVQTSHTQTDAWQAPDPAANGDDERISSALAGLAKELQALESRNLALEKELQRRLPGPQGADAGENGASGSQRGGQSQEQRERMENCLAALQRAAHVVELSCSCLQTPLAFSTLARASAPQTGEKEEDPEPGAIAACVALEHRLETQAVRLEHLHESVYVWREAAMQALQQPQTEDSHSVVLMVPERTNSARIPSAINPKGAFSCATALRGALQQIREHFRESSQAREEDRGRVLRELATALSGRAASEKKAAKIVHKWAGWEAAHVKEVRGLRRGFAEERLVAQQRRIALLQELDRASQREVELRAEVNALKKQLKHWRRDGKAVNVSAQGGSIGTSPPSKSCRTSTALAKRDDKSLAYPQLLLRLASVEQELRDKGEQLQIADETIRALSCCSSAEMRADSSSTDSVTRLTLELRRAKQQNVELLRRRELELVNVAQYFAMEKAALQMQTRLESERRRGAALQAAQSVSEQEIQDLQLEVEKLEMKAALASVDQNANFLSQEATGSTDGLEVSLRYASRRLELLETNRKTLREQLRRSQLQLTLMRSQGENEGGEKRAHDESDGAKQTFLVSVVEHHRVCVDKLKAFEAELDQESSSQSPRQQLKEDDRTQERRAGVCSLLLRHYEALWMTFQVLYAFLNDLVPYLETEYCVDRGHSSGSAAVLGWFGCQDSQSREAADVWDTWARSSARSSDELELSKRDEKILLLQQMLVDKDEQLHGQQPIAQQDGDENRGPVRGDAECAFHSSDSLRGALLQRDLRFTTTGSSSDEATVYREGEARPFGGHPPADTRDAAVQTDGKPLAEERTLLAPTGSQEPSLRRGALPLEVGMALPHASSGKDDSETMYNQEPAETLRRELERCRENCAALTAQNSKLTRRLRAACSTNSQYAKEHRELRAQLSASASANTELVQHLTRCQQQPQRVAPLRNSQEAGPSEALPKDSQVKERHAHAVTSSDGGSDIKSEGCLPEATVVELDALKEQLASREQENLGMVQSLCAIKDKCSQMERAHQHALQQKAVEHAESLERYMSTINERLSRIESEKRELGEENAELRAKVLKYDEASARLQQQKAQRCSRGTSIDPEFAFSESAERVREREEREARVLDLELQLQQERKLCAAVEGQLKLQGQQEEEADNSVKRELQQAKQRFSAQLQASREWRVKLQREFADCQAAQGDAQRESDKRLAFLAACVAACARAADTASASTGAKTPTSKELYDAVMALARSPPAWTAKKHQGSKSGLAVAPLLQQDGSNQDDTDAERELESSDVTDLQSSAEMWWKLRAAKLAACVRTAALQNETFEETIQQLELRMNDVKQELSTRLARESLLLTKQSALKSELATVKDHAAALAESYQKVSEELKKRDEEAASRGDQAQRARVAVQRKTELLGQHKVKVATLQSELAEVEKKAEKLATVEKNVAALHYKTREQTQQLQHVRHELTRCQDDNMQLSLHLEKVKERHASVLARLKATRAENTQLREQLSEHKSGQTEKDVTLMDEGNKSGHYSQSRADARVDALVEETRALKRRVLQKQDVIVSYKAKVAGLDEQLTRQRETMVKLARANRNLQQTQRQQQQKEQSHAALAQSDLETLLESKQQQLDGLRASVYDSLEAFVYCRDADPGATSRDDCASLSSSLTESLGSPSRSSEDAKLQVIRRWTDFSMHDLEELQLDNGGRHHAVAKRRRSRGSAAKSRQAAIAALRDVEDVLEAAPHDCRAEICQLLECLCGQSG